MTKPRQTREASSEEIKSSISRTRSQMDETLDELGERLHPRHLLDEAIDYFRNRPSGGGGKSKRAARRAGKAAARQVRENMVPSLLIGAGLAWLFIDQMRDEPEEGYLDEEDLSESDFEDPEFERTYGFMEDADYVSPVAGASAVGEAGDETVINAPEPYMEVEGEGETSGSAKEKMAGGMAAAKSSAKQARERIKSRASAGGRAARGAAERVRARGARGASDLRHRSDEAWNRGRERSRHAYERGQETFSDMADSHPLAMGAGFLAIGLLAGLALPSSRKERRWVGDASRAASDYAQATGEEAYDRAWETARRTKETAVEQMHEQGLAPDDLKEKAQHVYEETKHAAQGKAHEEGVDPQSLSAKAKQAAENTKQEAKREAEGQAKEMKQELKEDTQRT